MLYSEQRNCKRGNGDGISSRDSVIRQLAEVLGVDAEHLTLLARKIPDAIRQTMTDNPKAQRFLRSAGNLSDKDWDRILEIAERKREKKRKK